MQIREISLKINVFLFCDVFDFLKIDTHTKKILINIGITRDDNIAIGLNSVYRF